MLQRSQVQTLCELIPSADAGPAVPHTFLNTIDPRGCGECWAVPQSLLRLCYPNILTKELRKFAFL